MYQGKALSLLRLESGIGHLQFDMQGATVNKFDRLCLSELAAVLDLMEGSDLRGLVCTSAKHGFIAGADIGEFTDLFRQSLSDLQGWLGQCNNLFTRIEQLPFPTVSAVAGVALGGGFEFCLATDYRVAARTAVFGFPEVGLGLCPGFGGTVRSARIMEPAKALEWVCLGRHYNADEALSAGAIDALAEADMLLDMALDFIAQALEEDAGHRAMRAAKTGAASSPDADLKEGAAALRLQLQAQYGPHNVAPAKALDTMLVNMSLSRDEALVVEQTLFCELARSQTAHNLIGIFTSEQYLRQKNRSMIANAHSVERPAVLGAGIMGGGIAYQSALKGVPVRMQDIAQSGLDAGLGEASRLLDKQVEKGRLSVAAAQSVLTRIHPTLDYDNFADVDLVIEAVVENAAVKKRVLKEVEGRLDPAAILTSNTSTISITSLARDLRRPDRFCGMHFFNPVPLMPLVEVIRGAATSAETVASTLAFAQRLGKTPIVVNDCPGFLVNRILFPYFGAFAQLLRDGADFRQIDQVMESFGWPMGPALLLDVVGIDTAVHAQSVMAEGYPERMRYGFQSAMDLLFERGELGQKSGSGFYRYDRDESGRKRQQVDERIVEMLRAVQSSARTFSDTEIEERMMLAMCLETVRCLEDGIVASAIEADMGLVLGLGFPRFRGGALRYIDAMGARAFCEMADRYATLGPLYEPTSGLRAMAVAEGRFYA
jgi:3-hydroxyacyl-CoA dehydrogenase/enoyl-CoA hydratase/3-hydroxybutyryl-CoA epimerase/enoyl-CoA isomerase